MNLIKGTLSAVAALTVVMLSPIVATALRYREKATGFAVVTGGFKEAALSPVFWFSALVLAGLFWMAGRLGNKFLRVLLFWIPTASISAIGCIILTFILYVFFHFHRT
jgi:hypothetical protein